MDKDLFDALEEQEGRTVAAIGTLMSGLAQGVGRNFDFCYIFQFFQMTLLLLILWRVW